MNWIYVSVLMVSIINLLYQSYVEKKLDKMINRLMGDKEET